MTMNSIYVKLKLKELIFIIQNIYKEYVISLSYGSCKRFIINKAMWNIFRTQFESIDKIYGNHDRNITK